MFEPLAKAIAEQQQRYHALPPREKAFYRGGGGAGIIGFCLWIAVPSLQRGASPSPAAAIIWALVMVFAFLWLRVGWRESAGPRATMHAFWSAVELALGFWLFSRPWMQAALILQAISVGIIAEGGMGLLLALRGMRTPSLPDPRQIPGMPISGPASPDDAQRALRGKGGWQPPKFRD